MNIVCRRRFFQILAKPRLVVDGHELLLEWNKIEFIPLAPRVEHHLVVKLAYSGKPVSALKTSLVLDRGEVRNYEYRTPLLSWPGKLNLVVQRTRKPA